MRYTVVLSSLTEQTKAQLNKIDGYSFHFIKENELTDEICNLIEVIIGNPSLNTIQKCNQLKWIQTDSAGVNQYHDLPDSILLTNAYGAYGVGIAEYMLACVLASDRNLLEYQSQQEVNNWHALPFGKGISQMNVLSIGMGSIGSSFLKTMHALGATCYGITRTKHDTPSFVQKMYTNEQLEEVLPMMDVVALSLPETPETIQYMDAKRLSLTKQGCILINVGRGSAIDEVALINQAKKQHFKAVWLDVTSKEPLPKNHPLWHTPSIHITPHISGRFSNPLNYENVCNVIIENLIRYQNQQELIHIVKRDIGY